MTQLLRAKRLPLIVLIVLVVLSITCGAFATESVKNASEAGWYLAGGIILLLVGYWVRTVLDKDLCKKCGMSGLKRQVDNMEWLIVTLCERNGIKAEERRKYLDPQTMVEK